MNQTTSTEIKTIDRYVEHVSTVPAIAGQTMKQFLREKCSGDIAGRPDGHVDEGQVVLMIHGGFWPCSVAFDCPYPDYSWMEFLAKNGYDVFALDMTGHGRSALPLQADINNLSPKERESLLPGVAGDTNEGASYPYCLANSDSETADINAVVDFIRDLRGVDKVKLIGWSGGGIRVGTYALAHPEKVERVVIWASSNYLPDGPDAPPSVMPAPGYPTLFQSREFGENVRWRANIKCDGQVEDEALFDIVWRAGAEADPIGAQWGGLRGPTRTYWGWTRNGASRFSIPALVMVGECDRLLESNIDLYGDLGTPHKAFLRIACASHFMMWERARHIQRRTALEWLDHGTLEGNPSGKFRANEQGQIAAISDD
ncbi:MAG: alpha/beta fold hydrolase [Rhodospirillales bacterium]|jgi:pimeloyl-ACP methyl ester carboxylesterase|nr:alpha/beta fold hydrolase [Rhodospirillales bacterium]MBT5076974.1 alpha/beta fold hydrolase [Rhodospirillales bacterium]MBT5113655.1 alpha/beta fold hydrolase [Rhodospirillales bacterium]MBT5673953.1 alpha/beta fold hydrolase [Rhodospirillales bacterium]MBT6186611.1 alpha/beta fold hydrolase [Rhodospirillales bacterium]